MSSHPAYAAGQALGWEFRKALKPQLDALLERYGHQGTGDLGEGPEDVERPAGEPRRESRAGGGARASGRVRTASRTPPSDDPGAPAAPAPPSSGTPAAPEPVERERRPEDHPEMPPSGPPVARVRRPGENDIPAARGVNMRDVHPELRARLARMHRDAPPEAKAGFQAISGHRTQQQQIDAYQRYRTGRGGIAARPGRSRHQYGEAVDIQDSTGWYHRNAAKYGLHFPVRGDRPHMQMNPRYRGEPFAPGAPPATRDTGAPAPPHPFLGARGVRQSAPTAPAGGAIQGAASTYNPLKPGGWRSGGPKTASGEPYSAGGYSAAIQSGQEPKFFGGSRMGYGRNYTPRHALVEHDGKQVIVKINDRGPLTPGRVIDLNEQSMKHFDPSGKKGVLPVVKVTPLPPGKYTPGPVPGKGSSLATPQRFAGLSDTTTMKSGIPRSAPRDVDRSPRRENLNPKPGPMGNSPDIRDEETEADLREEFFQRPRPAPPPKDNKEDDEDRVTDT